MLLCMTKEHPLKGRKQSPEHVAARIAARKRNKTYGENMDSSYRSSDEYVQRQREAMSRRWAEGEFKDRPGRVWTEEQKRAASEKRKQMWAEGRYDNKKPARRRRVSNMERALAPYLEALGYRHTEGRECFITCGDGKVRMPDFVDEAGRRVFEYFGNFWHHPDDEQHYIEAYRGAGWECVVLWEYDLAEWLEEHRKCVTPEQHEEAARRRKVGRSYPGRGNPEARLPV